MIADRGVSGGRRTPTTRARRTLLARSRTPRERRSEAIAGGEGVRRRANLSEACRAMRSRECDAQYAPREPTVMKTSARGASPRFEDARRADETTSHRR